VRLSGTGNLGCFEAGIQMPEPLMHRIKKAEEAIRELVKVAGEIRQEAAKLPIENPVLHQDLLQTAQEFEAQAQDLSHSLLEWRKEIQ
jgi:hypothetical protein